MSPMSPMTPPPNEAPSGVTGDVGITFAATLIDQWVRLGVRHAVVSPGSRSTPLALACANHAGLMTHIHHDERSAAFMALGIGKATGIPALVVTTSGTAAVELHPAVVEAFQAHVPMMAVTADRPPELQGVGAPQTIDQRRLFGSAVRWFVEPGPPDDQYREFWRHLATDALRAAAGGAVGRPPGPVHLNLAFREPLMGVCGELPPPLDPADGTEPVWGLLDEQIAALAPAMTNARGVIVAGARAAASADEAGAILSLADALGWPVIADHLSGVRLDHASVVTAVDSFLRVETVAAELRPEFVLRIGGLHASRVLNEWLGAAGASHVGLDRWGSAPDPDHVLVETFTADVALACTQLTAAITLQGAGERLGGAVPEWAQRWRDVQRLAAAAIAEHLAGEPAVVAAALAAVPDGGALVVSSSMPVRDLEWYAPARPDVTVLANRGANGIDGVMSTAVGVAASGVPTVCLIGDVAFLHDSNALLGLRHRGVPLCVVAIDNDGGGIFSFLPQATALEAERFEQLFGTPHGVDLVGLCRSHGIEATVVDAASATGVASAIRDWSHHSDGAATRVVVVRSDRGRNVEHHRAINDAVRAALG